MERNILVISPMFGTKRLIGFACGVLLAGMALGDVPATLSPASTLTPTNGANPTTAAKFVQRIPGSDVTFEMTPIPAGTFKMGSPDAEKGHKKEESPQITVQVDALYRTGASAVVISSSP